MNTSDKEALLDLIESVVENVLQKRNLLTGQWQLGTVDSVISSTKLTVKLNGSSEAVPMPCNPDVSFQQGDAVYVIFANGKRTDKFVLCKRGIQN